MPAKSLAGEERHTWMVAIGGGVYDVHGGGDDDEHNWRQYDINDDSIENVWKYAIAWPQARNAISLIEDGDSPLRKSTLAGL